MNQSSVIIEKLINKSSDVRRLLLVMPNEQEQIKSLLRLSLVERIVSNYIFTYKLQADEYDISGLVKAFRDNEHQSGEEKHMLNIITQLKQEFSKITSLHFFEK